MIEIGNRIASVEPVFIKNSDDIEYQLICTAQAAANSGNWIVGECACRWLQIYGKGRTDEAFGDLIGLSKIQVFQRRRVWEAFGKIYAKLEDITWTHFREALNWEEAEAIECLTWANQSDATIAEMKAWRRAQRGEDLFAEDVANSDHESEDGGYSGIRQSENTGKTDPKPSTPEGRTIYSSVPSKPNTPSPVEGTTRTAPSAATGKAERATCEAKGNPESPSQPVAAPVQESETVAMILRKIDHMISFVVDRGSESERAELLGKLKTVVSGLDPGDTKGKKQESVAASLAIANVVINEWNMIDGVVLCKAVTPKRRQAIQARMKDPFWKQHWREAIDKIRKNPAFTGKNDRNWRADIDWFLRPDVVVLVVEGKYDHWKAGKTTSAEKRKTSNDEAFAEVFGDPDITGEELPY